MFVAKSFFFFCCFVKCFGVNFIFNKVGEQRSLLNVDECLSFFFLLLNTCAVVFQKSRRKRRVTGCGRQDFPSTLSSLKVTGAFFFHLPHRFVTMRENNVFSLKRCENCVSAKKKKKEEESKTDFVALFFSPSNRFEESFAWSPNGSSLLYTKTCL